MTKDNTVVESTFLTSNKEVRKCIELGGTLPSGADISNDVCRRLGISVKHCANGSFIIGTTPTMINQLAIIRVTLLRQAISPQTLSDDIVLALTKRNPITVTQILPTLVKIFNTPDTLSHFSKVPKQVPRGSVDWKVYNRNFSNWSLEMVRLGLYAELDIPLHPQNKYNVRVLAENVRSVIEEVHRVNPVTKVPNLSAEYKPFVYFDMNPLGVMLVEILSSSLILPNLEKQLQDGYTLYLCSPKWQVDTISDGNVLQLKKLCTFTSVHGAVTDTKRSNVKGKSVIVITKKNEWLDAFPEMGITSDKIEAYIGTLSDVKGKQFKIPNSRGKR